MSESILIVDDEHPVRDLVCKRIERMGYSVLQAESGEEALDRIARTPVDVVITDLKMEGMDGLTLAQRLLEQDPDRPVLLMTAYADLDNARRAVGIGIYEYFIKPFDLNDLSAGIRRAMDHRRLTLENRAYQKSLERKIEERTRELRKKIRELEARDELLRHLLSPRPPHETLSLAVRLALGLCACDIGALYIPDDDGTVRLGAVAGFETGGEPVSESCLRSVEKQILPEILSFLQEILANGTPVWERKPGAARKHLGIHSFGLVPVWRNEEMIAVLEVDRQRKDVLVGERELDALEGLLSYIAMAVIERRLQEELPRWEENVEEFLKASEKWAQ